MADYGRPQIFAQLRRWDEFNDRWTDHFGGQDALVEISVNRGRVVLSCRGQNYQPFETPIDDAALVRSNDQVFQISKQGLRLELWFSSWRDAEDFQQLLGRYQLTCRDTRRPNFDQGPPYINQGSNYTQGPGFDRGPSFDQPPPHNQPYGGQRYDQGRYPIGGGGQDQGWNQNPGPGVRDVNHHYQNIPPNDQWGGAPNYGRNQPQYGDRAFANNQPPLPQDYHPGGRPPQDYPHGGRPPQDYPHGGRPPQDYPHGGRPPQDYPPGGRLPQDYPPGRVQDARPAPREAWGPDQRQVHPQSKMKRFSENIDFATASLAEAINRCDLQTAYDIIKEMDIEKIDKSKRIFNVAINYYGDLNRQESVEEAPVEDKDEFKLKVTIERQCSPTENAIDIYIKAKEEDTIDTLEKLFEDKYKIPGEVQRWIIKQKLASDQNMRTLRDFEVFKDRGPDQEVYLFVIQGMKERMKSDFFNKRQQQVEDTQKQQQQMAQAENYNKQLGLQGAASQANRNDLDTMRPDMSYQQQQHQPYGTQYQGHHQDQGPLRSGTYHQDHQQLPPVGRQHPQPNYQQQPQPAYQPQPFQPHIEQPRVLQPRNDFRDTAQPSPPPAQRNDFNAPRGEPMRQQSVTHYPEQRRVHDVIMPPNNQGPRGGVPVFPMAPIQKRPANEGPLLMAANPVGQAEKPNGWNCSKCTFLNEPYRPGCKMCSAERPENYEVPVGHVASTDELKFINEVHQ